MPEVTQRDNVFQGISSVTVEEVEAMDEEDIMPIIQNTTI